MSNENIWIGIGLLGQLAFTGRFALQWIYSEIRQQSIVPRGFWYLSIIGSALLLSYAIYRQDPVFILGQSLGFIVYIRNLQLIFKHIEKKQAASSQATE